MTGLQIDINTLDLAQDANGRLLFGSTDNQCKFLLLKLSKGSIKRLPDRCVGIDSYIESEEVASLLREVRKEYIADGMTVKSIQFVGENLEIDAEYNG